MDEKPKKDGRTKAVEKEKRKTAVWKLTEEDKKFLLSCSIRPE